LIASFERRFVFIKTRKTAGTSVEIFLSGLCGAHDIITPIAPEDERMRPCGSARNYATPELERAFDAAVLAGDDGAQRAVMRQLRRGGHFYNHMPASEVLTKLPEFWPRAFKFTVERHPYEKAVSMAYWKMFRHGLRGTFAEALDQVIAASDFDDLQRYTINGKVAVDRIVKQEDLAGGLREIGEQLGFDVGELPRAKSMVRTDKRPARDILSPSQKRTIIDRCRYSFENLGYEP
jgi:hypothetical protein